MLRPALGPKSCPTYKEPIDCTGLEDPVRSKLLPPWEILPPEFQKMQSHWCQFTETLFHTGGRLPVFKPGLNTKMCVRHIDTCLSSWEPDHKHKIAGVAWLISLWAKEPAK